MKTAIEKKFDFVIDMWYDPENEMDFDHVLKTLKQDILEIVSSPPSTSPKLEEMLDKEFPIMTRETYEHNYFTKTYQDYIVYRDKLLFQREQATKFYLAGEQSTAANKISDEQIIEEAKKYAVTIGNGDGSAIFDFQRGAKWHRDNFNVSHISYDTGCPKCGATSVCEPCKNHINSLNSIT